MNLTIWDHLYYVATAPAATPGQTILYSDSVTCRVNNKYFWSSSGMVSIQVLNPLYVNTTTIVIKENHRTLIQLPGFDLVNETYNAFIQSLPAQGSLYLIGNNSAVTSVPQMASLNPNITNPNRLFVEYDPPHNDYGNTSFTFSFESASNWTSGVATLTIVILPTRLPFQNVTLKSPHFYTQANPLTLLEGETASFSIAVINWDNRTTNYSVKMDGANNYVFNTSYGAVTVNLNCNPLCNETLDSEETDVGKPFPINSNVINYWGTFASVDNSLQNFTVKGQRPGIVNFMVYIRNAEGPDTTIPPPDSYQANITIPMLVYAQNGLTPGNLNQWQQYLVWGGSGLVGLACILCCAYNCKKRCFAKPKQECESTALDRL